MGCWFFGTGTPSFFKQKRVRREWVVLERQYPPPPFSGTLGEDQPSRERSYATMRSSDVRENWVSQSFDEHRPLRLRG